MKVIMDYLFDTYQVLCEVVEHRSAVVTSPFLMMKVRHSEASDLPKVMPVLNEGTRIQTQSFSLKVRCIPHI